MTQAVDSSLGDALAQLYAKKYFPEAVSKRMIVLIDNLKKSLGGPYSQTGSDERFDQDEGERETLCLPEENWLPSQVARKRPPMNFTPFYNAFNMQPGDKMYKRASKRITVW